MMKGETKNNEMVIIYGEREDDIHVSTAVIILKLPVCVA